MKATLRNETKSRIEKEMAENKRIYCFKNASGFLVDLAKELVDTYYCYDPYDKEEYDEIFQEELLEIVNYMKQEYKEVQNSEEYGSWSEYYTQR